MQRSSGRQACACRSSCSTRGASARCCCRPTSTAPGKERYLPDPDPRKTMLGAAQWAWLRSQLQQPAEPYGQYEITSSGLNMSYAATRSPDRSGSGRSTGPPTSARSTSNWWAGRVTLSVRAANGKPVRRTSFAFELPGR